MQDEDGTGFIRFYDLSGNETTYQRQSYFYAYQATGVETGRYFVYRYRLPANGLGQTQFTIFTSTKNGGMTAGDNGSAPASERKDGEWIAFTNIKTYSTGNDGIGNDVNKQNMGIDSYWTNSQFNGHLTTGDLAIDYAGQTVTLDFGFAPNNNSTAIQFVKTFKNLQVADAPLAAE